MRLFYKYYKTKGASTYRFFLFFIILSLNYKKNIFTKRKKKFLLYFLFYI
jgi:hypothetical protein